MNENEIIIPCRLSYAHVWEPQSINGGDAKYSVCLLIDKDDTATVDAVRAKIAKVRDGSAAKWNGKIPANLKLPLRDGDTERDGDENYRNKYFINANATRRPRIVDRRLDPITDEDEVYSGCYAKVKVSFFAYNTSGNRGIGCGLEVIQKIRDGESLAGGSGTEGFEALPDEVEDLLG